MFHPLLSVNGVNLSFGMMKRPNILRKEKYLDNGLDLHLMLDQQ